MTATLAVGLVFGHLLGDFMIQQHGWSARKAERSLPGQVRMGLHVVTYTAACWGAVYFVAWADGLHIQHGVLAAGMAVNALTHWILDLRTPLERIVRATGHGGWLDNDGRALFIYDQVLHVIILFTIAAGIAAAS